MPSNFDMQYLAEKFVAFSAAEPADPAVFRVIVRSAVLIVIPIALVSDCRRLTRSLHVGGSHPHLTKKAFSGEGAGSQAGIDATGGRERGLSAFAKEEQDRPVQVKAADHALKSD